MKKILISSLKIIIFFIGWTIIVGLTPIPSQNNPVIWRFWAELGPLIAIIGFTFIFYLVEHKKISIKLYNNPLKSSLVGIVGGTIWLGLSVGILMLLRIMKIDGYNSIPMLWLWII